MKSFRLLTASVLAATTVPRLAHRGMFVDGVTYAAIARNVAVDVLRKRRLTSAEVPDLESVDEPLPYEELRRLTADLPQKERAAVFLRYGYDLSYEDIGTLKREVDRLMRERVSTPGEE